MSSEPDTSDRILRDASACLVTGRLRAALAHFRFPMFD
jgi:hypothetical protein